MPDFQTDTSDTDWVNIYMAGDIDTAKRFIAQYLYEHPQCVTVTPTTCLYHGGVEEGFVVGLINYPRFPSEPSELWAFAAVLAEALLIECGQHSYTQTAPSGSVHVTRRKPTPNEAKR